MFTRSLTGFQTPPVDVEIAAPVCPGFHLKVNARVESTVPVSVGQFEYADATGLHHHNVLTGSHSDHRAGCAACHKRVSRLNRKTVVAPSRTHVLLYAAGQFLRHYMLKHRHVLAHPDVDK